MTRSVLVLCARSHSCSARVKAGRRSSQTPAPTGERSLAALLERGLPAPASGLGATALATRWHGLAENPDPGRSRSEPAFARCEIAAGVSQTG
jgi:hypothetical protein